MSIMPPDSCTVSEAGVSGEERVHFFVFLVFSCPPITTRSPGLSPLDDLGQLRSLAVPPDVANMNVIAASST